SAGEPPAVAQLLRRERARVDGGDRRVAGDDLDLALLAGAVTAARRVDRDAVPARRVEDRRPGGNARLLDCVVLADLQEAQTHPVRVQRLLGEVLERAHAPAACFSR